MPGGGELFVIALVSLILFGPDRVPEIARTVGRVLRDLRRTKQQILDSVDFTNDEDLFPRFRPGSRDNE
ncbi:MAG TPA: twin-arginine translocase TatA/TatE family subunit [Armatimonadota bacterium]|jgi:Sec-independent protein translocase protein TatA